MQISTIIKPHLLTACASVLLLPACAQNASWHANEVASTEKQSLTVGEVQRNIKKGMSGGEVATILGSPNIVSTDENGNEVWIYDRFHTEQVASGSNGLTFNLSNIGAGAARTSQSTITVIIKYNAKNQVRDYAYHKSSF
jgi:outer membrane protein assembly factor BamE (lipoprotein component of BamABCDE complex)